MASPEQTSVVIPAFNEADVIGDVVAALARSAAWHEILVVDDGSTDAHERRRARRPARASIRHPYNKGNGASVKSGIREATGEYVLIIDADGQHPPEDAARLVSRLGEYDLVVGARAHSTQATLARRLGNHLLNGLATYLTGRPIPDLTSGFRAARRTHLREFLHLLPNRFSTPTTTTLAFVKAGYNVAFEPVEARRPRGLVEDPAAARRREVLPDRAEGRDAVQPACASSCRSASRRSSSGLGYAVWTIATQSHVTNSSVLLIMLGVIVFLMGLVSEQIAALRFEGRE